MRIPQGFEVVDTLHSGRHSWIARAVAVADGTTCILKGLRGDFPDAAAIARIRHEHAVQRHLAAATVRRAVVATGLLGDAGHPTLAFPDSRGRSVADVLVAHLQAHGPLPIREILRLGHGMAVALAEVHGAGVVHRDIKPSNVLVAEQGEVQLIDFGVGSLLQRAGQDAAATGRLVGTLAYIAPEQTGRMERPVDERSDLYALGATLYELLTGRPPFTATDPLALLHAHLAQVPVSVATLRPDTPRTLAHIVDTLLEKSPDDRYQTARGLAADLARCSEHLQAGDANVAFAVRTADVPDRFRLPTGFYGREVEKERVAAAFAGATLGQMAGILLVRGFAGAGKTALVRELRPTIHEHGGQIVLGKQDSVQRATPFAAVRVALSDLASQWLTLPDQELQAHVGPLRAALGPNVGLLVQFAPAWLPLLGPGLPPDELPAEAARHRFEQTLITVLRCAASPEHPLVIVLDDLQWVDPGTLQWLARLIEEPDLGGVLLILAWRANEVDAGHPFALFLATHVDAARTPALAGRLTELDVAGLDAAAIAHLVAATVHRPLADVAPLAALVMQRTAGNPFFARLFLERLFRQGLLSFHPLDGWVWDLQRIVRADITDNVAEMMAAALGELSPRTLGALGIAAALDSQPTLAAIAAALDLTAEAAWEDLWPAVHAGFLVPQTTATSANMPPPATPLRFQHDRVQQAAYEAIPVADRPEVHARIVERGAAMPEASRPTGFALANHALLAADAVRPPATRRDWGRMLVAAGQQARREVAYEKALEFLNRGLQWCGEDLGEVARFRALVDRYICEFLTGERDEADARFAELQTLAPTRLDKAEAMDLRIGLLAARGMHPEALKVTREALKLLGESLPEKPGQLTVVAEVVRVKLALGRRLPADVARLPEASDPRASMVMRILNSAASPAFFVDTNLYTVAVLHMCRLMLAYGVTGAGAYAWACYAMICGPILGDYAAAEAFSVAARALHDRFARTEFIPRLSLLLDGLVDPWNHHPAKSVPRLEEGVRAGGHAGDPLHAAFCSNQITYLKLLAGAALPELLADSRLYEGFSRRHGLIDSPETFLVTARFSELLMRPEPPPALLGETPEADLAWQQRLLTLELWLPIHIFHIASGFMHLLAGRWEEAIAAAKTAETWTEKGVATGYSALGPLTLALAALIRANEEPGFAAKGRSLARKPAKQVAIWARANPDGFGHRDALIQAEQARLRGDPAAAATHYERAVTLAGLHGFAHEEGLACARASHFFASRGNPRVAHLYRRGALTAWERWGALALTTRLRDQHPELRTETAGTATLGQARSAQQIALNQLTLVTTDEGAGDLTLDVATVLRAAEALSREIHLDTLIERLLRLLIESAGARRALLLLVRHGQLHVEGEIAVTGAKPSVLEGIPIADRRDLAHSLVRTAERTGKAASGQGETGKADPHLTAHGVKSAIAVPIAAAGALRGVLYLENDMIEGAFPAHRVALLEALSGQMAVSIQNAELYRDLGSQAEAFRRFVPEEFLHILGHRDMRAVALGDAIERDLTVLFSDVRGFTSFSETRPPAEVFRFLNGYLGVVGPLVRANGGFIDKYIGDAVMALFPNDPAHAVQTAVAMQLAVARLNENPTTPGDPPLRLGIGVHSGRLALGVLGEQERRETTVIGDAVNTAARLESLTKRLGASILISEALHLALPALPARRRLGAFAVAGRQQLVVVYQVIAHHPEERIAELLAVAPQLEVALAAGERGDPNEAVAIALDVLARVPGDTVAQTLLRRHRPDA